MELNDNEFDAAFRKKVFDTDPQYEEAAWDQMERKLRRRDRIVLMRRSALVLLILLAGVWGYYAIDPFTTISGKKIEVAGHDGTRESLKDKPKAEVNAHVNSEEAINGRKGQKLISADLAKLRPVTVTGIKTADGSGKQIEELVAVIKPLLPDTIQGEKTVMDPLRQTIDNLPVEKMVQQDKRDKKAGRGLPLSMALSAGPEFNSVSRVIGGNAGFTAGLTFGVGISGRMDLQAGLRYSMKQYSAGAFDYNPGGSWNRSNALTGVDASCAVLEIPLQASYLLTEDRGRSIRLNAGISSYLMLKEDYKFRYDYASGPASRYLEKTNANQHLMSVVDLSATYFFKVQDSHLKLGLEPFVKIPLTGVGEGRVNLKSSGVSLKIRYDLERKNN